MSDNSIDTEEIKKEAPLPEKDKGGDLSSTKFGTFVIKDRFEINFDERIQWLDNNGATAYSVVDKISKYETLFALICSDNTYARNSIISTYKRISNSHMMKLVERGVAVDPITKKENVVLIYEKPLGGKVINKYDDIHRFKENNEEIEDLLAKFVSILETLKNNNFTHRSIRLDNLYYKDEERTEIVLGDCLASFPAYHQPAICETIESLIASAEGRGNGTIKDDIYSFGILALQLFTGMIDRKGSVDSILELKLSEESYYSVAGNKTQNYNATKMIRFMVEDDEEKRWSVSNLYDALNDKHSTKMTPKSLDISKKSIIINDEKIYSTRQLAILMSKNIKEAYEIIKNGKISEWVKNGLQNEDLHTKIEKVIKLNRSNDWEVLTSKIMIIICPLLPIIYKGIKIFPDALGKSLYITKNHKDSGLFFNLHNEMLSSEIVRTWYQENPNFRSPVNPIDLKTYIDTSNYGYGIFRVIYEIDNDAICDSVFLNSKYIFSATRVLQALESYHEGKKNEDLPIDKKLIGFLYGRLGNNIDKIVRKINSNKEHERISGMIKLFAMMQIKYGPAKLLNLTKWLAYSSSPTINSFHNLKQRKFIEKEIVKILPSGNIQLLYNIIDNETARKKDIIDYNIAISEVSKLTGKKNNITNGGKNLVAEATRLGQNIVSITAIIIMLLSFLYNIINWVSK